MGKVYNLNGEQWTEDVLTTGKTASFNESRLLSRVENFMMTRNAEKALHNIFGDEDPEPLNEWVESTLRRFNSMDWGCICDEDKETNLASAKRGGMVMGVYVVEDEQIWIILDAGHKTLTVLMAEDY